jgi:pyrroline-5-carboxylate reductase
MISVALFGAGGKMGCRLANNLVKTDYSLMFVEPYESGQARLAEMGLTVTEAGEAAGLADVVILAVPDNRIGEVAHEVVPMMKPGASLIMLDAAAPYAGTLPDPGKTTFFACHPCHPSVFNNDETTPEAQTDYFGGQAARQEVVIAPINGGDTDYDRAEAVIRAFFAPVTNTHRITIRDMALLEPVLSETVAATCITIIREAMDECVNRGVPAEAARAFVLGHMNIEMAILFKEVEGVFSDGAIKAIDAAKSILFQPDWKRVFNEEEIRKSVAGIVQIDD